MTDEEFMELARKAQARVAAMTEDERVHMWHEQRISFAAGNVALSWAEVGAESALVRATRVVREKAGPCPCRPCVELHEFRGSVLRSELGREHVRSGYVVVGEIEPCLSG